MTFSLVLTSMFPSVPFFSVVSLEIEIEHCILIQATCNLHTYINAGNHMYVSLTSGIITIQETIGEKAKWTCEEI